MKTVLATFFLLFSSLASAQYARTDRCETGIETGCRSGVNAAGQPGSPMSFLMRTTDALPVASQAPINTAFYDSDFSTYAVVATSSDATFKSSCNYNGPQNYTVGAGGQFWAADDSMLIVTSSGGKECLLFINTARFFAHQCSVSNACITFSGLADAASGNGDSTHFGQNSTLAFDSTIPNLLYEEQSSGTLVNKVFVCLSAANPGCGGDAGPFPNLVRSVYHDFVASGLLCPGSTWRINGTPWLGTFNVASNGALGFSTGGACDWVGSTSYVATDSFILPSANNPNNCAFQAANSGTSSAPASEPTWSVSGCTVGATVTDNTITWKNIGKISGQDFGFTTLLFVPGVGDAYINWRIPKLFGGAGWSYPTGIPMSDSVAGYYNNPNYGNNGANPQCPNNGQVCNPQWALTDSENIHDGGITKNPNVVAVTLTDAGSSPDTLFTGKQSCRTQAGGEVVCYNLILFLNTLLAEPSMFFTNGVNGRGDQHIAGGFNSFMKGGGYAKHLYSQPNTTTPTLGLANPGTQVFPHTTYGWADHAIWISGTNDANPITYLMTMVPAVAGGNTQAWEQEIVNLLPDGSETASRLIHNYNTGSAQDFNTQNNWGNMSQDGRILALATDMMGTRHTTSGLWHATTAINPWSSGPTYINPDPSCNTEYVSNTSAGFTTGGTSPTFCATCPTAGQSCSDNGGSWLAVGVPCNNLRGGAGLTNVAIQNWTSHTAYPLNSTIGNINPNPTIWQVTSLSGTGTSGASIPSGMISSAAYQATVTDNAGANQLVWTMEGYNTCAGDTILVDVNSALGGAPTVTPARAFF